MSQWESTRLGRHSRSYSWAGQGPMSGFASGGFNVTSAGWPATNLILYAPVVVHQRFQILKFLHVTGATTTGNFIEGLYTFDGTQIAVTASTAHAASTLQATAPSSTTIVAPGLYYQALIHSENTASYLRSTTSTAQGIAVGGWLQEAAGSFALPAVATFATITNAYTVLLGMTRDSGG